MKIAHFGTIVSATVAAAVEENGCVITRDLAPPLAYLIIPSGPFLTLIWSWNSKPVHTAPAAKNGIAARAIPLITDPPYTPDFSPVDFSLFPKLKEQLAGLSLTQESLTKTWGGVSRTITADNFAATFRC